MAHANSVQQAIIEQVTHGLRERGERQRPTYMIVDDTTIRVHMKRSGAGANVRNTDVRYDSGPDTYTVTMHTFGSGHWDAGQHHALWIEAAESTREMVDVYADQLADFCGFPGGLYA